MLYTIIRSILFRLEPEHAHRFILQQLRFIKGTLLERLIHQSLPIRPIKCMGLHFPNALGLAAGLDKNGECIDIFSIMGFGFIEVGTVTPLPQLGNVKPRVFRLVEAEGIINSMGFNNQGVDYLVENISKSKFKGILGINIGINKNTPLEKMKEDYITCMEKVYMHAGYIAINISSPNTLNLRMLQCGQNLDNLLASIKLKQKELQKKYIKYVPIVIKIAPDLSEEELIKLADSLVCYHIDGVIATNSTLDRKFVTGLRYAKQQGGLSGRPIQSKSTKIIHLLSQELKGKLPIIGVGGIDSLVSAREKIDAGATLIQIYSGLIYHGPSLIKKIVSFL
ncbi:quinone-dependent dihydroorotate dehydrogenase [Pantoea sp. Mhis]|uniref:quinone-dependent dihydroorotate dehydrogenase n=1 Tax=Pantoea sp. Mhis TaxID=2576759 RepID=UPI00135BC38B|nr:quinone-dependent dihydroorotate dehydrogenase [Pantoea sp. Mhis]MXP56139.1 quinone-dependent dihydroorotate dehydrogenase [Pantoea sp. Mhis]